MIGIERFEEQPASTVGELLERAEAENVVLRTIIFNLYNGSAVNAEHVQLYQEIGEGTPPAA